MDTAGNNNAMTSVALATAKTNTLGQGAAEADTDYRIECIALVDLIPEFRDLPMLNMTNKTLRIVL